MGRLNFGVATTFKYIVMRHLICFFLLLLSCSLFAQVKPNEFQEATEITNSDFEFYSQKSDSTRRASANTVKEFMVPDVDRTRTTAPDTTGNTMDLMEFLFTHGDSIYYLDSEGDAALLYDPQQGFQDLSFSGDTLYISDGTEIYIGSVDTDNQTIDTMYVSNDTLYISLIDDGEDPQGIDLGAVIGAGAGATAGANGVGITGSTASLATDTLTADVTWTTRGSSGIFKITPYSTSNNLQFLSNEANMSIGSNRNYTAWADTARNDYVQANGTWTIYDLRSTTPGVEYASDYSDDFTDRSLIDKEYVDDKVDSLRTLVYVTDFGATGDDTSDDYAAFDAALNYIDTSEMHSALYVPPGTYYVNGKLQYLTLDQDISIIGLPHATIVMDTIINPMFQLRGVESDTFTLASESLRGQDTIILASTTGIDTTNWILLESNQTVETGWGYEESDFHRVYDVPNDTTVILNTKLNFGYDPGSETVTVTVADPIQIRFENLTFKTTQYTPSAGAQCFIQTRNVELHVRNCDFIGSITGQTTDHVVISQSIGSRFEDVRFRGGRYGALINYSRDVRAENIEGEYLRHVFVPATFTDGLTVRGLVGWNNNSTIDSHPSFNIWYDDVRTQDAEFPNCRAWGIKLTNIHFGISSDSTYNDTYAYFFMYAPQVNADWIDYMLEYDAYFDNVYWVHPNGGKFNGLVVPYCRNLTYRNCISHSLGNWSQASLNMIIDGCQTAHVEAHASGPNSEVVNMTISNTIFDGDLADKVTSGTTTDVVIRQFPVAPGLGIVRDCRFQNFNDTVNYVTDQLDGVRNARFYGCHFADFKGFGKSVSSSVDNESFRLIDCVVKDFTDSLAYELTSARVDTRGTLFYNIGGSTAYMHYQGDTLQNVAISDVETIRHDRGSMPAITIVDTDQDTVVATANYKVEYDSWHSVNITFYEAYSELVVMIKGFMFFLAIPWRRKKKRNGNFK